MVCFCHIPATTQMPNYAAMKFNFSTPQIPIQMKAALALGLPGDTARLDLKVAALLGSVKMPNVKLSAGPLLQIKLAMGTFDLLDLPKLQMQLAVAMNSFAAHYWPKLAFLARLNMTPILQLAMVARLKLALDAIKFNPAAGAMPARSSFTAVPKFALKMPQIHMGQTMLAIPVALQLQETFGSFAKAHSHFAAMARMPMPTLAAGLTLPMMLKIAAILDALAVIQEAFGVNAMTPGGLSQIAGLLKLYAGLPMPSPLPPIELVEKLPSIAPFENLSATTGALAGASGLKFQLPGIPVMAAINAALALKATLGLPVNACGAGACPFGAV